MTLLRFWCRLSVQTDTAEILRPQSCGH